MIEADGVPPPCAVDEALREIYARIEQEGVPDAFARLVESLTDVTDEAA